MITSSTASTLPFSSLLRIKPLTAKSLLEALCVLLVGKAENIPPLISGPTTECPRGANDRGFLAYEIGAGAISSRRTQPALSTHPEKRILTFGRSFI